MWLILSFSLFAEPALDHAQSLILRKDRAGACAAYRRALSTSPPGERAAVREGLNTAARLFFTDKGQSAYETARASLFETTDAAIAQLTTALALEAGNVAVRVALARALMIKGECEPARTELAAARALNPADAEVATLDLRALVCLKNFALFRERVKALPTLGRWEEHFVMYLQALDWSQGGASARAGEALAKVTAEFPKFPEAHFELARLSRADRELKTYVNQCHAVTARERREFGLEPRLCANLKEAEDELAKKSVDL